MLLKQTKYKRGQRKNLIKTTQNETAEDTEKRLLKQRECKRAQRKN